jgi:thymidine kinase
MSYTISVDISPLYNIDNISNSQLTLCIGPMFSGKTSYLLEKINEFNIEQKKFIVIKPNIDIRYNINKIVNHNSVSYDCISLNILDELDFNDCPNIILIDEGQFFSDLYDSVKKLLSLGKQLYIAGLNGDYKMELFGQIINLLSIADNIIYKQAQCSCGKSASFTARTVNDTNVVLIGSTDKYLPVCKQCYYQINKNLNINKLETKIM